MDHASHHHQRNSEMEISSLVQHFELFLFDCDGVLWRGSELIQGAKETLSFLRSQKKKIVFVTNNSTKSRVQYLKVLNSFGLDATKEEIISSSYAVAKYLKDIGFHKKVYVIGGVGIFNELEEASIPSCPLGEDDVFGISMEEAANFELDPEIGAVVVGLDVNINYKKLAKALRLLQQPDVLFIASNTDETFPHSSGLLPGAGSIVASVETCSKRKPLILGKPNSLMMEVILSTFQTPKEKTIMIGDRLETDIQFGIDGGIRTLLVLTGVTKEQDLLETAIKPTWCTSSVADLIKFSASDH